MESIVPLTKEERAKIRKAGFWAQYKMRSLRWGWITYLNETEFKKYRKEYEFISRIAIRQTKRKDLPWSMEFTDFNDFLIKAVDYKLKGIK